MVTKLKNRFILIFTLGVVFATPSLAAEQSLFGRARVQDRQTGVMNLSDFNDGRGLQCNERDRKSRLSFNTADGAPVNAPANPSSGAAN